MYEEPTPTVQASFSRGEVNPKLFGRVDLAAYGNSLRTLRNMFVRSEGAVSNRAGFAQKAVSATSTTNGSYLVPFIFSTTQAYIIEFAAGTISVYSFGVLVTSGIVNPYALADIPNLRYTQSADTVTVFHQKYPPYELKRTSSTTFTFLQANYINGPFLPQNTDGTTFVYASAKSGTVTLTANANIFNANHVGALFQLTQQDLSNIQPWEPQKQIAGNVAGTPTNFPAAMYRRSNSKNYLAVSPVTALTGSNEVTTGTVAPSHSQGVQADGDGNNIPNLGFGGLNFNYQDSGFGVVLITAFTSATQVTGVVQPNYTGGPGLLPTSVVGGPVTSLGPFTFSGDGSTKIFSPLTANTQNDPTKFYVTINGVYQSPSLYSIVTTTITFVNAPAAGTNNIVVKQISSFGQTSFWAFGALSPDQGYPYAGSYIPDRLVMAGTQGQPVGVYGSKTSIYHDFGVSSPLVASDAFTIFLNARQLNAITDLIPLDDLIIGTSNVNWRLWPGSTGTALSPLAIGAKPQNYYGMYPKCASVLYGESAVYVDYNGRRIRDLIYQIQFDKFVGQELTLLSRHLIPYGTSIVKMAYQSDPTGQLYALRSDGVLLCCTYLREQEIIGWSHYDTNGVIEDIAVVPENNTSVLYALVRRTINGAQVRFLESIANREFATINDAFFVDCGLTYDGRNTGAITITLSGGTTWTAGDTVSVTASAPVGFQASDVTNSNEIWMYDASGNLLCRALITGFGSTSAVTARLREVAPVAVQNVPSTKWGFGRTHFTASTLPNTALAVLADGNVEQGVVSDSGGNIILQRAAVVVQAGLQYLSDFETLPLNRAGQEIIRQRAKSIPIAYIDVTETRGFKVGTNFTTMIANQERAFERYDSPTNLQEGITSTRLLSDFDQECHLCVRQDFPLPITIRMTIPDVNIGSEVG